MTDQFADYVRHGWRICPIEPGSKGPRTKDWQRFESAISDPDRAAGLRGAGLLHAWTRTCALDIDRMEDAECWLAVHDIDLRALLEDDNAVRITSGRSGRAKLLYVLPPGVEPLPTYKRAGGAIEFRCSTGDGLSVQDVLPPTVHPDTGMPYAWAGAGTWRQLPVLPAEVLTLWKNMPPERTIPTAHADGAAGGTAEGSRNETLFKRGCKLARQGKDVSAIFTALLAENEQCKPPLATGEVHSIARSAVKYKQTTRDVSVGASNAVVTADTDVVALDSPDLSDDHLALDFVQAYGTDYRWSPGLGWMNNTGIVWRRDDVMSRFDLARRICRAAAASTNKPEEQKRLASAKTVNAVLSLAQSDQRIVVPATAWDGAPMLINTPAGIVDLCTGELRSRRHDDYVTQVARVAPDFTSGPGLFTRFMNDVFGGDEDIIDFMQVALGYCLTGERREQVLFFWHGSGSNGKSTLLDLVQWLFESYALKLPSTALMVSRNERHPTELAQLRGKRLVISSELEEGQSWNEALIKELTGDEVLTARFMRQDFFEFAMSQKHVIVGNVRPRLRGGDPAIARRLVLVPFDVKFDGDKRDRRMLDKLKDEAPAILAWIIRGAVRWHHDGLQVPKRVRDAGAEYLADHDDLQQWTDECCTRSGEAKAADLYSSFKFWKAQRGEHAPSMTTWAQRLQAVPGIGRRRSNGWRYTGIRLNEQEERRVRYAA